MRAKPSEIAVEEIAAGTTLQHCGRIQYRGQALHFGHDPRNRYDDPDGRFGALYLAWDLETALLESVFHDHSWDQEASRIITGAELSSRIVRLVRVRDPLRLASLIEPGVARIFGLNGADLSARPPVKTQKVAAALHDDPDLDIDGICYPSRMNPGSACVALYPRAAGKVALIGDIELARHADWTVFEQSFEILVAP